MKRSSLTSLLTAAIIALVLVFAFLFARGQGMFGGTSGTLIKDSGTNISDYSAVFLTNGQVYFGKVYGRTAETVDLRNIYYLQVNQQVQPEQKASPSAAPTPQPQVSLVKLGNELHGPNDRMQISTNQVLFTESLKNDSKVVDAIRANQK